MIVKLLTEHHLEFLSLKEAAQARLSLNLSKRHIVGNLMHWLNFKVCRACFSEEDVTLGSSRRLTEEYFKERQFCNHARVLKQRTASLTNSFWRDQ